VEEQKLLEAIVKAIVKNPDKVAIQKSIDDRGVLLRVWVAKEDMGGVIGKKGLHASAIKLIMKIAGRLGGRVVSVIIEEPQQND
jgi:hypothetical protein